MGCGQSRPTSTSPTTTARAPSTRNGRDRADTIDREPIAITQSQRVVNPSREQWNLIFVLYYPAQSILDPVDVISGLEQLCSKIVDHGLGASRMVFLQRHLRRTVGNLSNGTLSPNNNYGYLHSDSNGSNNNNKSQLSRVVFGGGGKNTHTDARLLLEKQHLIGRTLLQALLPESSIQTNIITLMLFLSESLWERVANQALYHSQQSEMEMDVNKQQQNEPQSETDTTDNLPKPSLLFRIKDVLDDAPAGTSLLQVATILGLAYCDNNRHAQLQLLFYCLCDSNQLLDFMKRHPAGGCPVWLLEACHNSHNEQQQCMVSWSSLAHYHYYGTAPLRNVPQNHTFVTSSTRAPLTVEAAQFRRVLLESSHSEAGSDKRSSDEYTNNNSHADTSPNPSDEEGAAAGNGKNASAETSVMQCLREVSEKRRVDPFTQAAVADLLLPNTAPDERWNIQDFFQVCDKYIDDTTLNAIMHNLFGRGIFPSPELERQLVLEKWVAYNREQSELANHNYNTNDEASVTDRISHSVSSLLFGNNNDLNGKNARLQSVWGGLGNIDGKGGLGYGVMYCIPATWWNQWASYSGWIFINGQPKRKKSRPLSLQTESLLEQDPDVVIRGVDGSYELMKKGLKIGRDYVMVPPGVWDVLYELYTGGPPLPRMVLPNGGDPLSASELFLRGNSTSAEADVGVPRLPEYLRVATHPWVLHVHLCDPLQPYRRGEAGPVSIRVMAAPDQPLWRVFGEIVCRFGIKGLKAFDSEKEGKARLWKRIKDNNGQAPPRYGPWNLVCKKGYGLLPLFEELDEVDNIISNWRDYCCRHAVRDAGLVDHDSLMLEYAIQNKNGELTWPREAAAEAGKARRLAEEDRKFRQLVEGVDEEDQPLLEPPNLVGMEVDAEDSAGRWFTVKILDSQILEETDSEEEVDDDDPPTIARKKVKVSFKEHGGHVAWIDVSSDRLQAAGRFASEASGEISSSNGSNGNGDGRSKSGAAAKKSNSNAAENGVDNTKLCPLPGFGSCGLSNLGNTCYMNSAVQCMAYLPLLRAYLVSAQYKRTGDLNKDNPLGTGGKLLEEFAELLRAIWSSRYAEKSPVRFRQVLGKTNMQFSGADQQDAQEFLNYIYDVLREDSNKVRKKPYVESLEDDWVAKNSLVRVGEESWRRFLRRDRSIMSDIAMGQVLNTVTCPVCHHSSRKFDEFNLLSVPIPAFADVVFQCTIVRRASAKNCGSVLNKPRKNDKKSSRYSSKTLEAPFGPPSDGLVSEQYVVALSRLADGGDLRLQLQNLTGIHANRLRLCRTEEVVTSEHVDDGSPLKKYLRIIPLSDKDGPVSQHAKKANPGEDGAAKPTKIVAFETTLLGRPMEETKPAEDSKASEETSDDDPLHVNKEEVMTYIRVYGDDKECRLVDTDPLLIAKAVSRSLWPRSDKELRVGLRVDAKDTHGKWFPGSIVEISDVGITRADSDTGEEITIPQRKVRIHFDNYMPKWDEVYSIESFKKGRVLPLYSHAKPKLKPTEFAVRHRYIDKAAGHITFGQSFYVQCRNEWSNARAGAHILAQASRFLRSGSGREDLFDRVHTAISDLIDFLIDCDREFIQLSLGISKHSSEAQKSRPFRNPSFDSNSLLAVTTKKISAMLQRLPFEVLVSTVDTGTGSPDRQRASNAEDITFPFALNTTIGNFVSVRNVIILQWKDAAADRKSDPRKQHALVPYANPRIHVHESSTEVLSNVQEKLNNGKKNKFSDGVDLAFCLSEFCKVQKLQMSDNWKCPRCKVIREGGQNLSVWRLPDMLTFHIKRFNMSARWHEKILTKVNFPMTGLDMSQWCHGESPVRREDPKDSYVYDLIGVMNHYGSMTGGHYVATCKATHCTKDGKEEVGFQFNGPGANTVEHEELGEPSGLFGRSKPKVNQSRIDASLSSNAVAESAEPMWLQFDDEVVEAIPPRHVVSEMAYVLFYRRRRINPSNIAKYSTLD